MNATMKIIYDSHNSIPFSIQYYISEDGKSISLIFDDGRELSFSAYDFDDIVYLARKKQERYGG